MQFLPPNALAKSADFVRAVHFVWTEGVTLDDLARPAFWAHHASRLVKGDEINVVDKRFAFDVTLRVVEVGTGWVKMRPLRVWTDETIIADAADFEPASEPVTGLEVQWAGPHDKWRVVRKADKWVLSRGLATKAEAVKWAEEHEAVA